jgi:hypothetical protein
VNRFGAAFLFVLAACVGCNGGASSVPDAGAASRAVEDGKLELLTYNILASPIFNDIRLQAVFAILDRSDADVIALQEVTDEMLRALLPRPRRPVAAPTMRCSWAT